MQKVLFYATIIQTKNGLELVMKAIITVVGKDRTGIVAGVAHLLYTITRRECLSAPIVAI